MTSLPDILHRMADLLPHPHEEGRLSLHAEIETLRPEPEPEPEPEGTEDPEGQTGVPAVKAL